MNNSYKNNKSVYIIFDKNDLYVSYFISYLVAALKGLGIDAVSETTGPEPKNGRFFGVNLVLVVFSNPFTFSEECLKNLVELQKFGQEKGHVVIPVFYEESVSVIKEQMERSDAFAVHEKSFSVAQVAKWRDVLVETIELQGHDHDLSEESDFIEKIVEDIFDKLCPTEHIGNQKVIKELENLLCNQPWGRRTLAIVGKPGIGKTTLARAAFQKMSSSYDTSRFITFGKEEKIELLSDEYFKEIPMEKFDLNQDDEPCQRPKRVLLILDNVQSATDVKDFLVGYDRFGPGSLLIITSRHREVLEQYHVNDIYELKGLSNEDSLKLLTRFVFEEDVHDVDEKSLKFSVEAIKNCDGNPSAILSRGKKMKQALNQSLFVIAGHNYQSDLQKFPERDVAKYMLNNIGASYLNLDLVQQYFVCATLYNYLSVLKNLPRFISPPRNVVDLSIPHTGQEYSLVRARLPYKSLPDFTTSLLTDQLEPNILNLRGCLERKHFQEFVRTIRECRFEAEIRECSLERDEICPHCNSANETGSHLYFNITFSWSILTRLIIRIHNWYRRYHRILFP